MSIASFLDFYEPYEQEKPLHEATKKNRLFDFLSLVNQRIIQTALEKSTPCYLVQLPALTDEQNEWLADNDNMDILLQRCVKWTNDRHCLYRRSKQEQELRELHSNLQHAISAKESTAIQAAIVSFKMQGIPKVNIAQVLPFRFPNKAGVLSWFFVVMTNKEAIYTTPVDIKTSTQDEMHAAARLVVDEAIKETAEDAVELARPAVRSVSLNYIVGVSSGKIQTEINLGHFVQEDKFLQECVSAVNTGELGVGDVRLLIPSPNPGNFMVIKALPVQ